MNNLNFLAPDSARDDAQRPVLINIERMTVALEGPAASLPQGLSREQQREFILAHAGTHESEAFNTKGGAL